MAGFKRPKPWPLGFGLDCYGLLGLVLYGLGLNVQNAKIYFEVHLISELGASGP